MALRAEPRRFVLVSHNAGGTVPPMLALAQAMVRRGHDVTWLSQPSVRDRAVAAGCRFEPLVGLTDYATDTAIEEQLELAMMGIAGVEIGEQLIARVRHDHTDAVVVDCNLASAAAAAESLAAPSALLFHSMFKTFSDVWFGELWPFLAAVGAGIALVSEAGSAEIGDALDDVLADPSFRRSAAAIASASADAGGASAVIDDLESFLPT